MKEKLKNKRGITLIALIITIIVMLILVGVTVTVALNGGLFTTAKKAATKTELERDKEILMEAALGALGDDGKVVYEDIQLPEGFTGENGTYTKGDNTFIVDEYGTVTEKEKEPWYKLTDEEKQQLETTNAKIDYSNVKGYFIAREGYSSVTVWLNNSGEYLSVWIDNIPIGSNENVGFIYLFDESYNDIIGCNLETDKWYYLEVGSHPEQSAVENTNPISEDAFENLTINCQTYLDRIIASFNN